MFFANGVMIHTVNCAQRVLLSFSEIRANCRLFCLYAGAAHIAQGNVGQIDPRGSLLPVHVYSRRRRALLHAPTIHPPPCVVQTLTETFHAFKDA